MLRLRVRYHVHWSLYALHSEITLSRIISWTPLDHADVPRCKPDPHQTRPRMRPDLYFTFLVPCFEQFTAARRDRGIKVCLFRGPLPRTHQLPIISFSFSKSVFVSRGGYPNTTWCKTKEINGLQTVISGIVRLEKSRSLCHSGERPQ